jgi:hypothetical protein
MPINLGNKVEKIKLNSYLMLHKLLYFSKLKVFFIEIQKLLQSYFELH